METINFNSFIKWEIKNFECSEFAFSKEIIYLIGRPKEM